MDNKKKTFEELKNMTEEEVSERLEIAIELAPYEVAVRINAIEMLGNWNIREKWCFVLYYLIGFDYQEIAELMGTTFTRIRGITGTARKKLLHPYLINNN